MTYLVDTNILLRLIHSGSSFRPTTTTAIRNLIGQREKIVMTPQNAVEFWSVATRATEFNGLGLNSEVAARALRRFEGVFELLPDIPAIYQEWRQLVLTCRVLGRQVYDARLAAVMLAHGITHLLTFDTADFKRYPGIIAVHPRDVDAR